MRGIATMNKLLGIFILIGVAADAAAKTTLFKNATVHPISAPDIQNGQVLVTDGKITTVAAASENLQADEKIDLKGAHLYPGFINPAGWLGLVEIDGVRATQDMSEPGEFKPEVKSWLAVNPDSELIAVARANGITHTV